MNSVLLALHSGWRWVVLLVAVVVIVKMLLGWFGRRSWGRLDDQLSLVFTIVIDIEVLLGILTWFFIKAWEMGRIAAFEHPLIMLLAVVVAHVGQRRARRAADDTAKYRTSAIFYGVSFVLILVGVMLVAAA